VVCPHRLPETLHEAGVVAIAILGDDRGDRIRVGERKPPPDRSTVILDVYRVPGDAQTRQQARGQRRERVEGVVEILDAGRIGQPESEMIRGDDVIAVGQRGDGRRTTSGAAGSPDSR
jgi:hypothetical protein